MQNNGYAPEQWGRLYSRGPAFQRVRPAGRPRAGLPALQGSRRDFGRTILEHEAQRKLNVTLGIRLRGRDLAKGWVALGIVQTAVALGPPLRGVCHIERFRAELHSEALRQVEILEQGKINTSLPRVIIALDAECSGRARRRRHHGGSIKPLCGTPSPRRGIFWGLFQ